MKLLGGSSFMKFYRGRTKKVINYSNFKIHWWVYLKGGFSKMGQSLL